MKRLFLPIMLMLPVLMMAQLISDRPDGRLMSTRGALHEALAARSPRLGFHGSMSADSFAVWQKEMCQSMQRLMCHPSVADLPAPTLVSSEDRDGYRLEKWESYPLPSFVVPFYVLVPDGVDAEHPAPASVLCIPGFGQTKELLAGEVPGHGSDTDTNAQAQLFAKNGYVAVAVDNPSFGELRDNGVADYLNTSRILLEMDWNYLGLASYQDKVILDWLKQQPHTNAERIIVSGFSLGTEPLMALGLLDPTIYAFVYNDFLCRTRERILVMTKPDAEGRRPFPNSLEHLVPGLLLEFDFPDVVCALAPRPVICTEGGMDRDFELVQKAYESAQAPDGFTYHHYAAFVDDSSRANLNELPGNIDRTEYFKLANVDPPHHYYKWEHIYPWLQKIFKQDVVK